MRNSLLNIYHILVHLTNICEELPGWEALRIQQATEPAESFASQSSQFSQALLQWSLFNFFFLLLCLLNTS